MAAPSQQLPGPSCPPAAWREALQAAARLLFVQRMRTHADRRHVRGVWQRLWGCDLDSASSHGGGSSGGMALTRMPQVVADGGHVRIGSAVLPRPVTPRATWEGALRAPPLLLPSWQAPLLESAARCMQRGWMCLLVGGAGSGKTSLARLLARLAGRQLLEVPLTSGTDTSDLLGSFEQVEPSRRVHDLAARLHALACEAGQALALGATAAADPAAPQQGGRGRLALAQGLAEAWEAYASAAATGGAAAGAGGGDAGGSGGPVGEALRQLGRLDALLAQLQALPQEVLQAPDAAGGGSSGGGDLLARVACAAADVAQLRAGLGGPGGVSVAGRCALVLPAPCCPPPTCPAAWKQRMGGFVLPGSILPSLPPGPLRCQV